MSEVRHQRRDLLQVALKVWRAGEGSGCGAWSWRTKAEASIGGRMLDVSTTGRYGRLRELATERRRFAHRRLQPLPLREGRVLNGKKLYRLYKLHTSLNVLTPVEFATPSGADHNH